MTDEAELESPECTPPELRAIAADISNNLLPKKSKDIYMAEYKKFEEWRELKHAGISENVLLAYFTELSEKYKPPTLWAKYSFIRSTLSLYDKIDISKYALLLAFLKRLNEGYVSKKARPFTPDEFNQFMAEAPDEIYLVIKIAAIFGIMGALRIAELTNVTLDNITDMKDARLLLVKVLKTKTGKPKSFIVPEVYYDIVEKYRSLRPKDVPHQRLFVNYQNGRCTIQPIGKNKLGGMPKLIAAYLNLPEPERYTGHAFRRTCITWMADSGADIHTIKQHGVWSSTKTAERYCEDAKTSKTKIADIITSHHRPNDSRKRKSDDQEPISYAFEEEPTNDMYEQQQPSSNDMFENSFEPQPSKQLSEVQRPCQFKRFKPKTPSIFSQFCAQSQAALSSGQKTSDVIDVNNNNNIIIELDMDNFDDFITEEYVSPVNTVPRHNYVFNNCNVTFNQK